MNTNTCNTKDEKLLQILKDNINMKPLTQSLNALASVIKSSGLEGSLYPFGSFCNGFPVDLSDLDVVFVTASNLSEERLLRMIDKQIQKSKNVPKLKTHTRIFSARIPILKIKDETNQVDIDLSINNINGIINSKLLLEYSKLHPKIEILGKLLKLWGKKNGIISQSGLSSYALILAMIYYLQQKHNIPCLQNVEYTNDQLSTLENLELNPYFKLGTKYSLDDIPMIQLFEGFFMYYQTDGEFSKSNQFISINGHNENAQYRANTLPMLDPINRRHDPSKKFKTQTRYYQKLFSQTVTFIQRDDFESIFLLKKHKEKKIVINQQIKLSDEAIINVLNLIMIKKQDIELAYENLKKYIESKFLGSKLEKIGDQNESYGITQCDIDCNLTTSENIDIPQIVKCLEEVESYNVYKSENQEFIVFKDQKLFIKIHLTLNFQIASNIHNILTQYSKLHPKIKYLFQILKTWSLQPLTLCKLSQEKFSYFHLMMIHFLQEKYNTPTFWTDTLIGDAQTVLDEAPILDIFNSFLTYFNEEFQSKKVCLALNGKQSQNDDQSTLLILNPFSESEQQLLKLETFEQIQQYFSKEQFIQSLYKLVTPKNNPEQKNPTQKINNKKEDPIKQSKKVQNNEQGRNIKPKKKQSKKLSQTKQDEKQQQRGKVQQEQKPNQKQKKKEKPQKEILYVPKNKLVE